MDKEELIEMFRFLQKAGANPQLCDTEVPYFEASVRAGIPAENWAEDAFVEMMMLPRGMLRSNPAFIVDVCGDSMVVPELGETPTSMTLYPRFVMDDAKIPEPQIFYGVEVSES